MLNAQDQTVIKAYLLKLKNITANKSGS